MLGNNVCKAVARGQVCNEGLRNQSHRHLQSDLPWVGFMVGPPGMLHEGRERRNADAVVAWMAGRWVQPESVEEGYPRPRCLKHQSQQCGALWSEQYLCRTSRPTDTNTQIPQHQPCRTWLLPPRGLEGAVLDSLRPLGGQ